MTAHLPTLATCLLLFYVTSKTGLTNTAEIPTGAYYGRTTAHPMVASHTATSVKTIPRHPSWIDTIAGSAIETNATTHSDHGVTLKTDTPSSSDTTPVYQRDNNTGSEIISTVASDTKSSSQMDITTGSEIQTTGNAVTFTIEIDNPSLFDTTTGYEFDKTDTTPALQTETTTGPTIDKTDTTQALQTETTTGPTIDKTETTPALQTETTTGSEKEITATSQTDHTVTFTIDISSQTDTTVTITVSTPPITALSTIGTSSPLASSSTTSGGALQEGLEYKGLSSGSIAAILCVFAILAILVFGGLCYKFRQPSYGSLESSNSYSSFGNFSNPMYDP
ncbi:prostate androgen-regulated mucin-like protein 1 homolog [Nerophis ophidion]|uniref:prostate androgen-regulated mucin-like protein 1 homolog n=1 Tax=Nerophis ophidion TaxID=159077 RepID=UPI002AE084B5|nr:prostate androgen-regulated mucin-like protein 1 homolog [Nerophis ophidion]